MCTIGAPKEYLEGYVQFMPLGSFTMSKICTVDVYIMYINAIRENREHIKKTDLGRQKIYQRHRGDSWAGETMIVSELRFKC